MIDYNTFKHEELSDSYKEQFFGSVFGTISKELVPFVWTEGKDEFEFELYILDTNTFLQRDTINFFLKRQKSSKPIICFSPRPLTINDDLFRSTPANFVKFSYFKNSSFTFNFAEPKACGTIELKEIFDEKLYSLMMEYFINDKRLCSRDQRMKLVYQASLQEFDAVKNKSDYGFFLHNGRLVACVAGLKWEKYFGMAPLYLVAHIWALDGLDKAIKNEISYKIIGWLNSKKGPYAAGVHYDNVYSRNVCTKNGFAPYFARFIKWPENL